MGNLQSGSSVWSGINLNSGAATNNSMVRCCDEDVDFGKRGKQKKFSRDPPHKKVVKEQMRTFLYLNKICWKTKMSLGKRLAPHHEIQPKFWRLKIANLTTKIIRLICQIRRDKVVCPTWLCHVFVNTEYLMPDSISAATENWNEKLVSNEFQHTVDWK